MKTATHAQSRTLRNVEDSIVDLFAACPELCGFTVKLADELELSDVGLWPQPPTAELILICAEIRDTLLELIDEQPEARRLIAGRTFARALH